MKNLVGNALLGQSGGPTSVINASAAGVFIEALNQEKITGVFGAVHGIKGILEEDFIDISKEDIEEKGWKPDPFDGLKILKGEMDYYYKADPEIQVSEDKKTYFETLVGVLSDIIVSLNWRHQNIKNIIEWKRFESGG